MWRLLFIIVLPVGLMPGISSAQEWSGTAALDLSGGHRTNLYLDPVLGTWNPDADSPFFAITPQLRLTRNTRRTRFDLSVRSRIDGTKADIPQFTQGSFRLRRRLHTNWTLGLAGGGTRYRYPGTPERLRTVRDSWWGLPSLQWSPTNNTMLIFRTGLTQRIEQRPDFTDRQTSGLVSLRATHWLTDRVQGGARAYYSSGRTSQAETSFGGVGGSLSLTYWPSPSVSIRGNVAFEQPRYETVQSGTTVRDRIGRVGIEAEWAPKPFLTLFGRARVLSADLERASDRSDEYASAGLRLTTRRVFGDTETSAPQRRVCENGADGLRLRAPYKGDGQPHVTGDFNNWSLPGIPLTSTDDDMWEVILDLPPGRYAYRLRVVDNGDARWLDLPSYAQTVKDPFGGTNGVCIVR